MNFGCQLRRVDKKIIYTLYALAMPLDLYPSYSRIDMRATIEI